MYYANDGGRWTSKYAWTSSRDHCVWHGITCNSNSFVETLNLLDNGLSGSMIDLSALSGITSISLDLNSLTGPIPSNVFVPSLIALLFKLIVSFVKIQVLQQDVVIKK